MSAAGAVKRAVRRRGGRAKAVEAAQKLSKKKQLTDNIESHLSHTSLSYASDPSAIISKMKKIAGEKTPLRVPKVPKTPKQEEQQLVTEVKEPSADQTERAQTRTEASAITGGSNVRTTKTGGMRKIPGRSDENYKKFQVTDTETKEQPTVGTGGGTQTKGTDTEISNERQAAQSGGEYDPTKFLEMAKDKNLGRSERWMLERLGNMRKNALKVFDNGTDEQIKNELSHWGIETREGAKAADYMNDIDEVLRKKAESGPTLGDKFRSHHGVGLTGLGVVGVSTLDLASSRGQQSNAQLYSDPFA